jgi:hypothetical protein
MRGLTRQKKCCQAYRKQYFRSGYVIKLVAGIRAVTEVCTIERMDVSRTWGATLICHRWCFDFINLIKVPGSPFYGELQRTAVDLLNTENEIRAYVKGQGDRQIAQDIGIVISNWENKVALLAILGAAKQTFHQAGLVPLGGDTVTNWTRAVVP